MKFLIGVEKAFVRNNFHRFILFRLLPSDDMDDVQEDYKVRVSSDFDRLVAFATEMNKSRDTSPKRESGPSDYRHMKDETRKMKHEIPADLSSERRMRMIEESRKRTQ